MGRRYETVTFLSDYGRTDEFVGVVHSVIRSIAPHAAVIDLSHDIAPHDIRGGGLMLARSTSYLCPGVVLAVVDPGVGGSRRAIAVEVGDGDSVLVGPDNGVLAPAVALCGGASRVVELTATEHHLPAPGPTFAGRDVFAPAAGALCTGVELTELGPELDPIGLIPGVMPAARPEGDGLVAEVLWVDRFGNAQLNLGPDDVEPWGDRIRLTLDTGVRTAVRADTYAEVGPGQIGLVIDSYGLLSIVVDRASAADELGLGPGVAVTVEPIGDDDPDGGGSVVTPVTLGARPQADDGPRAREDGTR